ncbi:MAG: hypothetical protein HZA59_14280 [Hydrogenophilales bacterium]|nr:hypothetical protein [Hydrogenophilales bacterium]
MPNTTVNLTACKLRLQVPSALRAPAAGYLSRWAYQYRVPSAVSPAPTFQDFVLHIHDY